MTDHSLYRKDKPGIVHFDSCEKAYNYIEELENLPMHDSDLIDLPITIHHMPSMQVWLMKALRLWKMNSDEDRMMRFILVARIMQATHKQILKHFGIPVTKDSIGMIRAQEALAFKKMKDIISSKGDGTIILPGNSEKFLKNEIKEVM